MVLLHHLRTVKDMFDHVGTAIRAAEEFERCRVADRQPSRGGAGGDRDMARVAVPI